MTSGKAGVDPMEDTISVECDESSSMMGLAGTSSELESDDMVIG